MPNSARAGDAFTTIRRFAPIAARSIVPRRDDYGIVGRHCE
jgi:hypothetical protein